MNISSFLEHYHNAFPENIALFVSQKEQWNYHKLFCTMTGFAHFLQESGFKAGDRIAIALGNGPHFVFISLAIAWCGMISVPMNPGMQKEELQYQLTDSGASGLVSTPKVAEIVEKIVSEDIFLIKKIVVDYKGNIVLENGDFLECRKKHIDRYDTRPDDIAQIIYSTAIDGYPKGVMLSHGNILSNCAMTYNALEITGQDKVLATIPMFHAFGFVTNCLAPLHKGATIYSQSHFTPKSFLRAMKDFQISIVFGVPTMFAAAVFHDSFAPEYLNSLRLAISGAAALPLLIHKKYLEAGLELRQGYGLTECSPSVTVNPLHGINKPESIGTPLQNVELRIVDSLGNNVACGEEGELLIKGPLVMKGYWHQPQWTRDTIQKGWLHTGDKARCDQDGYYYITGRIKQMIINGGFNVYPKEVEKILGLHPKIAEIKITGIPDLIFGELVKAEIRVTDSKLTARDIADYAKKHLAPYKIPKVIEFI